MSISGGMSAIFLSSGGRGIARVPLGNLFQWGEGFPRKRVNQINFA